MISTAPSIIFLLLLALFLGAGTWIFSGLIIVGILSLWFVLDFSFPRIGAISTGVISSSSVSWELAAIPIFLWMGDIIFRTDISHRLFRGLSPLLSKVPGGLLHTNVAGCTVFAAISGSGTATTATVGRITLPQLSSRGYDISLASGSLAGAGGFGLLIPPSIAMIIYGVLANVSIVGLFAAGILPGLMMAAIYSGYIIIRVYIDPSKAPVESNEYSLLDVLGGMKDLLPIFSLMTVVLGSIYSGLATPSEAAAVGVFGAIVITLITGQFSFQLIKESLISSVKTSVMILILIAAASFLSSVIAFMHFPEKIHEIINSVNLSPWALLIVLAGIYVILGMFIDGTSMTVMTVPIAVPLIIQAGFDPMWFGVFLVIMIELSTLTPPVGINLFIIQGLTQQDLGDVIKQVTPFFLLLCLGAILIAVFPSIALYLPSILR